MRLISFFFIYRYVARPSLVR